MKGRGTAQAALIALGLLAGGAAATATAGTASNELVDVSSAGVLANDPPVFSSVSKGGRLVVFDNDADNLVAGDDNNRTDVFLRNTVTNKTTRLSVGRRGREANGDSFDPVISANGRYVAFASVARNLVKGDGNRNGDIFVRDLRNRRTTLVSAGRGGAEANGFSFGPAISAGGHHVAFLSEATNLVKKDRNRRRADVFVTDLRSGKTRLVSVGRQRKGSNGSNESATPAISRNGRYIAWESKATNLALPATDGTPNIFRRDMKARKTELVSVEHDGGPGTDESRSPQISGDGTIVTFSSESALMTNPGIPAVADTNGVSDVFYRDMQADATARASVATGGGEGTGESAGIFSSRPPISLNGRWIAFSSEADNLVGDDGSGFGDVFVHDTVNDTTVRVSLADGGGDPNRASDLPAISPNGSHVVFRSSASNLGPVVPGDTDHLFIAGPLSLGGP